MLLDQRGHLLMNEQDPVRNRDPGRLDQTVIQRGQPRAFATNHAVADAFQTGIDTKNRQCPSIVPRLALTGLDLDGVQEGIDGFGSVVEAVRELGQDYRPGFPNEDEKTPFLIGSGGVFG